MTKYRFTFELPCRYTDWNCPFFFNDWNLLNKLSHLSGQTNEKRKGHMTATYADNLFLPFALLLAKTFLPLAVLILFLNPWTLDLCLFFGWYVIFIAKSHLLRNILFCWKTSLLLYWKNPITSSKISIFFDKQDIHTNSQGYPLVIHILCITCA